MHVTIFCKEYSTRKFYLSSASSWSLASSSQQNHNKNLIHKYQYPVPYAHRYQIKRIISCLISHIMWRKALSWECSISTLCALRTGSPTLEFGSSFRCDSHLSRCISFAFTLTEAMTRSRYCLLFLGVRTSEYT